MPAPTVLIIDDEHLVRWSLREHLTQRGLQVIEAASCSEARSLLGASKAPDVILLDLRLPDIDGLKLLEILRRDRPDCRIVVLSGYATPEISRWALDHGASFVSSKPFEVDAVFDLVTRALAT